MKTYRQLNGLAMKEIIQVLPKALERIPINEELRYIDYQQFINLAMQTILSGELSDDYLRQWIYDSARDKWPNPNPCKPSAMYGIHNQRTMTIARMALRQVVITMTDLIEKCLEEHDLLKYLPNLPYHIRPIKTYGGKRLILVLTLGI